jgi:hypothetical protein
MSSASPDSLLILSASPPLPMLHCGGASRAWHWSCKGWMLILQPAITRAANECSLSYECAPRSCNGPSSELQIATVGAARRTDAGATEGHHTSVCAGTCMSGVLTLVFVR